MSIRGVQMATAQELGVALRTSADVGELMGAAYDLHGLLLTEADLSPDFFDLRSGLAGQAFQTFANHQLPVALVIPDFSAYGARFAELAHEHVRHRQIRFVHTVEEGWAWLRAQAQER
ncbi:DUF4180 domain-containing protein [Deinococcus navajonensis]|uniref:DUF4180 domain-containing protein n=1 Tax=Deinococcus navajonensis TaxID=309884 RepID=A0ABV8XLQ3_9DEIO